MPQRGQLTRPMMRCRAGLHADQTRLERPEIGDDAAAPQPPANDDVSVCVDAVDLEPVFGEIQTDGGNLHGGRLLSLWRSLTTTLWHIDAGSGGRPPHQDFRTRQTSRRKLEEFRLTAMAPAPSEDSCEAT